MFNKLCRCFAPLLVTAVLFLVTTADAGSLIVETAWARATPGNSPNGAAYVTIANQGASDHLIGIETNISARAEVHMHKHESGVMKMRPAGPIEIASGGKVTFKPGGLHVMLMKLKSPLKEGEMFPMPLVFENAGKIPVMVKIMKIGAAGPMKDHQSGHAAPTKD